MTLDRRRPAAHAAGRRGPVAIGAGCAVGAGSVTWWRVAVALVVSLALQVGVNYANDYSDGVRGTDDVRVGPVRLVASGLQPPARREAGGVRWPSASPPSPGWRSRRRRAGGCIVVGVAAIAAAWFYTGGPRPYGYAGLGEVFVFVFFGLVATVGTTYVAVERVTGLSVVMGCAAGCLACALLVVNNLRDIPSDTAAGKRTLAVRLGDARTRWLYVALLAAAYVLVVVAAWSAAVGAAGAGLGRRSPWPPVHAVRGGARGPALIPVLGGTGRLQMAFGALATIGLVLSS